MIMDKDEKNLRKHILEKMETNVREIVGKYFNEDFEVVYGKLPRLGLGPSTANERYVSVKSGGKEIGKVCYGTKRLSSAHCMDVMFEDTFSKLMADLRETEEMEG